MALLGPVGAETTMIGMHLHHKLSGIAGTVDAEVIHPDGSVLVRITDRWFEASELVAA